MPRAVGTRWAIKFPANMFLVHHLPARWQLSDKKKWNFKLILQTSQKHPS
jgi:hypothetical protein